MGTTKWESASNKAYPNIEVGVGKKIVMLNRVGGHKRFEVVFMMDTHILALLKRRKKKCLPFKKGQLW